MRSPLLRTGLVALLVAGSALPYANAQTMTYPDTRRDNVVDDYHGTKVEDPYRWLEDDRSAETGDWVKRQNAVTFGYLEKIPYRKTILDRLQALYKYERYSMPHRAGQYLFYSKNDGLQNQPVIYRQKDGGEPTVFIDPNKLSKEGTTTVSLLDVSKDDKWAAFGVQRAGSDWQEIVTYGVESAQASTVDTLKWCKFSGAAWYKDGFYYSRYDAPTGSALSGKNEFQKVYYHKIGTPQSKDELVYQDKDHPLRYFGAQVTEDNQYLVLNVSQGTSGQEIWVRNLAKGQKDFSLLVQGFTYDYGVVDTDGSRLLVLTNDGAEKFRLVSIDPANPAKAGWKEVIPEGKNLLEDVKAVGGKLVVRTLMDVSSRLHIYTKAGKDEKTIELPAIGTVGGVEGDSKNPEFFFSFASYTYPTTIYRMSVKAGGPKVFRQPKYPMDLTQYTVEQVFFTSKDGTKVPMFLVHRKDIAKNGQNPTLLYGYGGFNINITPAFQPGYLPLLEQGGIVAMTNLRGGGEYGEAWHKAAMKTKKQTTFDDFISAAEYLIKEKYTSPEKLAIEGRSNGGLLVGAAMTQRPDLFKVAFPGVGVMDMLRFHKFTVGWGWVVEYGSSDTAAHFPVLHKYSPLHNLKKGTSYPATLIVTADHDDRVVPAHSFKYAATLQAANTGTNPQLIRIETNAGHGAGKPIKKALEERADLLTFMLYNMKVDYKQVQ